MNTPLVTFEHVTKVYDQHTVLDDLSFTIEQGKFYTLLGPSGCGKTTLLRLLAGFETMTSGHIYIDGQCIDEVPANQRSVNTVFQDYALFPHMNVYDNVAFGLKIRHLPKSHIDQRVKESLKLVQLEGYESRAVTALSGGQRQRIAIARALINEPKILLLDEALSALDLKLRQQMQYDLRVLQQRLGITFIFVTHDQEEALTMSDEIFVLNQGHIIQRGTPVSIYDEPINRFVAAFIGESNIIPGKMKDDYQVDMLGHVFECVDGGMYKDEPVEVVIRPEDLVVVPESQGNIDITVISSLFKGVHYELHGEDEAGNRWLVHTTQKIRKGQHVGLLFQPEDLHIMRLHESQESFDRRLDQYTE